MKKQNILAILIGIAVIAIALYIILSYTPKENKEEIIKQNEDKELLEKILVEINLGNFSPERCEELQTFEAKEICYKTYIIKKIVKNEHFSKNVCLKLTNNSDREVCLLHSKK